MRGSCMLASRLRMSDLATPPLGQRILDYRVEAAEHRPVQQTWMVGCRHQQGLRLVLLEKLKERVQHTSDFADVVAPGSFASQGVDLVEEVHAARLRERVEY